VKVITLSKVFLKGHPREGEPTNFRDKFLSGEKIHTIRMNRNGYYKDGDVVSVRQWSVKPYRSKQDVIADGVKIGIEPIVFFKKRLNRPAVFSKAARWPINYVRLAHNDGLSVDDFVNWFYLKSASGFDASIIHFTNFRYAKGDTE
jgi:hypothetical protein